MQARILGIAFDVNLNYQFVIKFGRLYIYWLSFHSNQILYDISYIVFVSEMCKITLTHRDIIDTDPVPEKKAAQTKTKFNYKDALNLESLLTDEEIMVRDQFHDYCQEKLMPRILMANRNEGKTRRLVTGLP